MVFSSIVFLFFFLPVVWTAYCLCWKKARNHCLLLASLVFYAWGEKEYILVLVFSILFNFLLGLCFHLLDQPRHPSSSETAPDASEAYVRSTLLGRKKCLLVIGVMINLGMLIFTKYMSFLASSIQSLFGLSNLEWLGPKSIHAPIGISFFTFHAISYLVDLYRLRAKPQLNPLSFAMYLSVFPKILAGPIVQYHAIENQLSDRKLTSAGFLIGLERFITGLAKKTLLANPLSALADMIFAIPGDEISFGLAWVGVICFTLQIYFDFSGYSDMAIGLGKTFGFDFIENFNFPYISQSVQDFWRRWHISLSQWFRDYLYIPLGGNKCSQGRLYFNLVTVFFLCGLWHGANWNFILWGLWYGFFLILERTRLGTSLHSAWRPVRHFYTMTVVVMGWMIFRSEDLHQSWAFLRAMSGFGPATSGEYYVGLYVNQELCLYLLVGSLMSMPLSFSVKNWAASLAADPRPATRTVSLGLSMTYAAFLGTLFLFSCMSLAGGTHNPFIYFKF